MAGFEPAAVVFITFSGFIVVVLFLVFIIHVGRRNLPLLTLFVDLLILNSFNFINALIWFNKDTSLWWNGTGLCDVEVKLYLAIGQSILGATASIFQRLASILNTANNNAEISSIAKNRQMIFSIATCYILPGFLMGVHYVVQPERYQIDRFTGCRLTWDYSWLAILLLWSWYPLVCGICLFYALVTTMRLVRYRRDMNAIFQNQPAKTTKTRFARLYGLSTLLMLSFVPLAVYFFVENACAGVITSYSWTSTHPPDWSQRIILNQDSTSGIPLDRWMHVVAGFLVIAFFGTGKETSAFYKRCIQRCDMVKLSQFRFRLWSFHRFGAKRQKSRVQLRSISPSVDLTDGDNIHVPSRTTHNLESPTRAMELSAFKTPRG